MILDGKKNLVRENKLKHLFEFYQKKIQTSV